MISCHILSGNLFKFLIRVHLDNVALLALEKIFSARDESYTVEEQFEKRTNHTHIVDSSIVNIVNQHSSECSNIQPKRNFVVFDQNSSFWDDIDNVAKENKVDQYCRVKTSIVKFPTVIL